MGGFGGLHDRSTYQVVLILTPAHFIDDMDRIVALQIATLRDRYPVGIRDAVIGLTRIVAVSIINPYITPAIGPIERYPGVRLRTGYGNILRILRDSVAGIK
jgi:hypothetical protein